MPAIVPLNQNEIVDEKIKTGTSDLQSIGAGENFQPTTTYNTQKPEAIVRPLRRREPSDDENRSPEVESLEAQIIDKLTKLEKPQKVQRQLSRESERRGHNSRDSKRGLKEASSDESILKRPLFITTVPRGVFLQPQPIVREIVAKSRHVYAYASHPKILNVDQKSRRDILSKQSSINSTFNQILHRNVNLISKNIRTFDDQIDSRYDKADDAIYKVTGVKITRTRESQPCQNLMFDRRVIRGSNFATTNIQAGDNENLRKEEEAKRRQILRKRQVSRNQRGVIGTPPPVRGRKHETIQTEKYLEELFSRPPEIEQSCQTDLFLQRPPTPVYITAKVGVDASTEIADGELFDFDKEVHSILENFVGTTLQQALTEVVHEEEVADLREKQHKMLAIREAERAELKRLESKEQTLQSEKTRRKFEDDERDVVNLHMNERITAAKLLQGHIADLLPSVLESIESVRDAENKEDLQQKLTPWLAEEVASEIGQMVDSQELLLEIVKEVLQHRAEVYAKIEEDERKDENDI